MPRDSAQDPYFDGNRAWWDSVVPIHEASQGYDREGFLRGEKALCPVELEELGPLVAGKTLLHLQCHFGMDTLNWARLGATVTGLDFSEPAVEAARRLSADSGIPGRFVPSNVYDAPQALDERFDIVYTGIGVLCWLPDVRGWARVAAHFVKPGGTFYIYEAHPMLWSLDDLDVGRDSGDEGGAGGGRELRVTTPYFETANPHLFEGDTTYVDGPKLEMTTTYEWNHGLGEIATALIEAGLRIEFIHEHREIPWKALPWMEPVGGEQEATGARYQGDRLWRLPVDQADLVPLMYSIRATKPSA
ncbi:MAG: class I SAM-dependent methyltransferase [Dehalococcoidia bacterium]